MRRVLLLSFSVALSLYAQGLNLEGLDAQLKAALQKNLDAGALDDVEEAILLRIESAREPKRLLEVIGAVYFLDKKYLKSAVAYSKAKQYAPLSERDRFTLAMDYIELQKSDWARRQLTDLVNEKPTEPLYRYWLGRLDYDQQRFLQATEQFRKAIELDPNYVRAYDGLGLSSEAVGDLRSAEEYFRHANDLNRQQGTRLAWPMINYGAFLRRQGRYSEARGYLNIAVATDASEPKAFYERSRVEEDLQDLSAAINDCERASLLDKTDPSAVYCLYRLYRRAGDILRSEKMLERFRELRNK